MCSLTRKGKPHVDSMDEEGVVIKGISSIERKPNTLHWDNKNDDALKNLRNWPNQTHQKAPGYKSVNCFEKLFLLKRVSLGESCSHRAA
jgi:hypothetical protein